MIEGISSRKLPVQFTHFLCALAARIGRIKPANEITSHYRTRRGRVRASAHLLCMRARLPRANTRGTRGPASIRYLRTVYPLYTSKCYRENCRSDQSNYSAIENTNFRSGRIDRRSLCWRNGSSVNRNFVRSFLSTIFNIGKLERRNSERD